MDAACRDPPGPPAGAVAARRRAGPGGKPGPVTLLRPGTDSWGG